MLAGVQARRRRRCWGVGVREGGRSHAELRYYATTTLLRYYATTTALHYADHRQCDEARVLEGVLHLGECHVLALLQLHQVLEEIV